MRVQAEAFDERELAAAAKRRGASGGQAARGPSTIVPAAAAPAAAVVLLIGGAGSLMAPVDLPVAGHLLAIGAVAIGGWLLGRGPRDAGAGDVLRAAMAERWIVTDERREVIRAALALASISGRDDPAERARRAGLVAAAVEPREDAGVHVPAGRAPLHAVRRGPDADGESLELDADVDALAGAPR